MHACVNVWMWRLTVSVRYLSASVTLHFIYRDWFFQQTQAHSLAYGGWLVRSRDPTISASPALGLQMSPHPNYVWLLCWCWGSTLRFSCLYSKNCTDYVSTSCSGVLSKTSEIQKRTCIKCLKQHEETLGKLESSGISVASISFVYV